MEYNLDKMTPEDGAKILINENYEAFPQPPVSDHGLELTYSSNGCFLLKWSQAGSVPKDWVGLYRSNSSDDSDYVTSAWQWVE
jgi:hypothetical protein